MLRTVKRLPLGRCIHTNPGSSSARVFRRIHSPRSGLALGASVTFAVAYMAWSLSSDGRRIALDAQPLSAPRTRPTSSAPQVPAPDIPSLPKSSDTPSSALDEDIDKRPPITPVEAQNEEESSGGAFNPVTGEINWDCPCLGGMAHGPCGPEFREAFSCFVYSEKEPKGIDCVEKFKAMQNCFRQHPDVYGDEIMDDDDDEEEESQRQIQSTDERIFEVEPANLDDVAEEHVQHPSSSGSTS